MSNRSRPKSFKEAASQVHDMIHEARRKRLIEAREIIEEIASAGVEYDARKYLVVQIAPDLIERAKKWLEAEK